MSSLLKLENIYNQELYYKLVKTNIEEDIVINPEFTREIIDRVMILLRYFLRLKLLKTSKIRLFRLKLK
ncbi:Uncharacterised protein [Haploplasma axanthum]|uniref:Uncharacterized protein n=1 Tax=Haploplasma axanthum TaxID=29552 RepID=A0A449BB65_HAPAX|nr:Uncharacterised protein [Haploplasma axanthum]